MRLQDAGRASALLAAGDERRTLGKPPAKALFWEGRVSELGGQLPPLTLAALFFARYEAGQLGGSSIEGEHLLLGLLRRARDSAAQSQSSSTRKRLFSE